MRSFSLADLVAVTTPAATQDWADRAVQAAQRAAQRITPDNIDVWLDASTPPEVHANKERDPDAWAALRQQARGEVWVHPRMAGQI